MLKPIPVSELEPGDQFIWADGETRVFMRCGCLAPEVIGNLGICTVKDTDGDTILFTNAHGATKWYSYSRYSRAYRLSLDRPGGESFAMGHRCLNCGEEWGRHSSMTCQADTKFVETFIPADPDSQSPKAVDDFFASLGL